MSANYANRSVTVKLHPLCDTNIGLSRPDETRARADYETPISVLNYSVALDRLFVSSENGTTVLYVTWNNTQINVENLFQLHSYLLKKFFKSLILLSKNTIFSHFHSYARDKYDLKIQ